MYSLEFFAKLTGALLKTGFSSVFLIMTTDTSDTVGIMQKLNVITLIHFLQYNLFLLPLNK